MSSMLLKVSGCIDFVDVFLSRALEILDKIVVQVIKMVELLLFLLLGMIARFYQRDKQHQESMLVQARHIDFAQLQSLSGHVSKLLVRRRNGVDGQAVARVDWPFLWPSADATLLTGLPLLAFPFLRGHVCQTSSRNEQVTRVCLLSMVIESAVVEEQVTEEGLPIFDRRWLLREGGLLLVAVDGKG